MGRCPTRTAMENLMIQIRRIGWGAVEAAFLLVVFCLLLNIILGGQSDTFISDVANNATMFLQNLPPGLVLGLALLATLYGFLRLRLPR